jgi:pilus assembly protein CpaB
MLLDRRFLVVVGASLIWALLVAGVFHGVAARTGKRQSVGPAKDLIVASRPLPLGVVVAADAIKTTQVPERYFPRGGFSRKEDVLERPVVSAIEADEPIVEARIGAKGSGIGLGPMIPPGFRAIAVRVNDVVGVAGFVLPGMRVDVLVTGNPPNREETMTATVLQNIPVLSAGQAIQADAKGQPISAAVVSLLVNPEQAEALTLANTEGHIQLVLRNTTDHQMAKTSGRHLHDLYPGERAELTAVRPAGAKPHPVAAPRPLLPVTKPASPEISGIVADEVIIIRGNQKTVEPAQKAVIGNGIRP